MRGKGPKDVGYLSKLLRIRLSPLQVYNRELDIGKRTLDKVTEERNVRMEAG
jgi:hypothetical protein